MPTRIFFIAMPIQVWRSECFPSIPWLVTGVPRQPQTMATTEATRGAQGVFPVSAVIGDFASPGIYPPLNTAFRKRTGNLYQSLDTTGKRV